MIGSYYSSFVAYAAKATNLDEVRRAYCKVRIMNPMADHIAMAYKTAVGTSPHDDDEHGAGEEIQEILQETQLTSFVVCVVRVYGGQQLWKKRLTS